MHKCVDGAYVRVNKDACMHAGSNGSLKEVEGSSAAKRRPTVIAPDAAETTMSVALEGAEPYMPTPASTVGSAGKENRAAWASGRRITGSQTTGTPCMARWTSGLAILFPQ